MLPGTTTFCDTATGDIIIFEHVPAFVCGQCGSRVFKSATVDEIERIATERPTPTRVVSAPVYDLTGGRLNAPPTQEATTTQQQRQ